MLIGLGLGVGLLVYAAFALDLLGFLARDEVWLRLLMLCATFLYILYFFLAADEPLWDAILADSVLAAVNLTMIGLILRERSTLGMSAATRALHRQFPLFSPGQFRRLMALAVPLEPADGAHPPILRAGEAPDRLFYLSAGAVEIEKGGDLRRIEAPAFLGEIAWLTGAPASATVRLLPGAEGVAWPQEGLRDLVRRREGIGTGLSAMLNADLAGKLQAARLADLPG